MTEFGVISNLYAMDLGTGVGVTLIWLSCPYGGDTRFSARVGAYLLLISPCGGLICYMLFVIMLIACEPCLLILYVFVS